MTFPNLGRRNAPSLWSLLLSLLLGLFGLVGAAAEGVPSASVATREQLKAAYLHKFPSFVEWPSGTFADAQEPFVIGVLGADGVYQELRNLAAGRPVQGRMVDVRRLDSAASPWPHVLFIGPGMSLADATALSARQGAPVLTVTDEKARFQGAVLHFVEQDRSVRFEASLPAAQRARLRLSARLLAVAARVIEVEQ